MIPNYESVPNVTVCTHVNAASKTRVIGCFLFKASYLSRGKCNNQDCVREERNESGWNRWITHHIHKFIYIHIYLLSSITIFTYSGIFPFPH